MSSSAIKKKSEPSHFLVFGYALLMACFGVFLGLIYLMSYPLEAYPNMEERAKAMEGRESLDPIPGDAFYIEGPTVRSQGWETKRKQLIEGSAETITVTAGEINAWFAANFRSAAKADDDESQGLTLVPNVPNLGISEDGTIYLSVPTEIKGYGLDDEYVLSAKVSYSSGAPASLQVEHAQLGGAAVPLPSVLGAHIVSTIINGFSSAEEFALIREAWARVESVQVSGGALVLNLAR